MDVVLATQLPLLNPATGMIPKIVEPLVGISDHATGVPR